MKCARPTSWELTGNSSVLTVVFSCYKSRVLDAQSLGSSIRLSTLPLVGFLTYRMKSPSVTNATNEKFVQDTFLTLHMVLLKKKYLETTL